MNDKAEKCMKLIFLIAIFFLYLLGYVLKAAIKFIWKGNLRFCKTNLLLNISSIKIDRNLPSSDVWPSCLTEFDTPALSVVNVTFMWSKHIYVFYETLFTP